MRNLAATWGFALIRTERGRDLSVPTDEVRLRVVVGQHTISTRKLPGHAPSIGGVTAVFRNADILVRAVFVTTARTGMSALHSLSRRLMASTRVHNLEVVAHYKPLFGGTSSANPLCLLVTAASHITRGFFAALILASPALAAPPEAAQFRHVEGAAADQILERFDVARRQGSTFSSDLVETKHLRILKQPVVSRGHVNFAAPSQFRFELREPSRSITVCDGTQLWMHYPDFNETEHYPLNGNARNPARQALAPILATFGEQIADWRKHYTISVLQAPGWHLFELTPKQSPLREQVRVIRLWVDEKLTLQQFELIANNGDRTVTEFVNPVVGKPIPDETFKWPEATVK